MLEDQPAGTERTVIASLAEQVDHGTPLAAAMLATGAFPAYVTGLVEVGVRTGRLEEALNALSTYYNARARMESQVRSALLHPALLLLLMLIVVVVLLARVLPVFDQVFRSLGGAMTGVAGGLLRLGQWLDGALPLLCGLLMLIAIGMAIFALSCSFRNCCLRLWRSKFGNRGVAGKLTAAQLAQALSMGLRSGFSMEEALELAASLLDGVPDAQKSLKDCRTRMEDRMPLADALRDSGVLPVVYCRMLALGARSGSADLVMQEIANRLGEESEEALQKQVNRVEPILTIAGSLLVGIILLSAMLPLLNILSAIG